MTRSKINAAFFERTKEARLQYGSGSYTRYSSEELREKAKRH